MKKSLVLIASLSLFSKTEAMFQQCPRLYPGYLKGFTTEWVRRSAAHLSELNSSDANLNLGMKTIGGLAAVAVVWILAKKLFGNKSIFRNINQILIAAEKHNDKLKELNKELSTKEALSSREEIIRLFNQCHVTKLTAELEIAARLATSKMKQEWTTLRTAHATFFDEWESIRKILNTANKTQLDDELIDVKGRLNKMYAYLSAIDRGVNSLIHTH